MELLSSTTVIHACVTVDKTYCGIQQLLRKTVPAGRPNIGKASVLSCSNVHVSHSQLEKPVER